MACSIRINQVTGNMAAGGDRIETVSINGNAQDCAAISIKLDVWGENERERLIATPDVPLENIDENGQWRVEFDVTDPGNIVANARSVHCGDHYLVTAWGPDMKACNDSKSGLFCACPNIRVSFGEEECIEGLRAVRFDVEITAGDEACAAAFSSGLPGHALVQNFVAQAGQTTNESVTVNYPTGEVYTAVFDILLPIGCESHQVRVGPLGPCCLTEETVQLQVFTENDCIVEGRPITFQVRNTDNDLLDDEEYDYTWLVNGNDAHNNSSTYRHTMGNRSTTVEVIIRQEGCPDVRLTQNVDLCECPAEPDITIVPQGEPDGRNEDDAPCYEDIPGHPIAFSVEGDLPPEDIFSRTWLIYKVDENGNREGDAIQLEDDIFEINGTTLRMVRRLEEGGYQVMFILNHREIPSCSYAAFFLFNICPKHLPCPQFDVTITPVDNRTISVSVAIVGDRGIANVRENGLRIDFGDDTALNVGGEEVPANGVFTADHAYPNRNADYQVTVSFSWAEGSCRQSEDIHTTEAPPIIPQNGKDECDEGCAWYDLSCWCLCDTLGRILALVVAAILTSMTQGVVSIATGGAAITVAGLIYMIWCDKCYLAKYIIMGVGIFAVVYIGLLIAALFSGTFLAFLAASWPVLVSAAALAAAAYAVLEYADECQ